MLIAQVVELYPMGLICEHGNYGADISSSIEATSSVKFVVCGMRVFVQKMGFSVSMFHQRGNHTHTHSLLCLFHGSMSAGIRFFSDLTGDRSLVEQRDTMFCPHVLVTYSSSQIDAYKMIIYSLPILLVFAL